MNSVTYASFPITENETTNTELVTDDANLAMEAPYGSNFDWTGFLLGFFLGAFGVLIAYLIDPYMLRSSLIGLAAFFVLFIILWLTIFSVVASTVPEEEYYY